MRYVFAVELGVNRTISQRLNAGMTEDEESSRDNPKSTERGRWFDLAIVSTWILHSYMWESLQFGRWCASERWHRLVLLLTTDNSQRGIKSQELVFLVDVIVMRSVGCVPESAQGSGTLTRAAARGWSPCHSFTVERSGGLPASGWATTRPWPLRTHHGFIAPQRQEKRGAN